MRYLIVIFLSFSIFHLNAQDLPQIDWNELQKTKPWEITEWYKEIPIVTPGDYNAPPSDAIVLFDGKDLSKWQKTPFGEGVRTDRTEVFLKQYNAQFDSKPADWKIENGELIVGKELGAIGTKQGFGDMQLHIEWYIPKLENLSDQAYGNSGIFLMGLYEIQVLNSFENPTYSNGQAGSIYKQHAPLVNASRPPQNWQTYDIFFTAPKFSETETLVHPAMVTILHNGVLVQYNSVLEGPTAFIGKTYQVAHPDKLPIVLQDHQNPVRYRNIWVREL